MLRGRLLDSLPAVASLEWAPSNPVSFGDHVRTIRGRATAEGQLDEIPERRVPAEEWPAFRPALLAGWSDLTAVQGH